MSKDRLDFLGWSKYGHVMYVFSDDDGNKSMCFMKFDESMCCVDDICSLNEILLSDVNVALHEISSVFLHEHDCMFNDDWSLTENDFCADDSLMPQPKDDELIIDMLRRWKLGEMEEYEEMALFEFLESKGAISSCAVQEYLF